MTNAIVIYFDSSIPLESHTLPTWGDPNSLQENIKSLLREKSDYLETPLLRHQHHVAGLHAFYNVPEQREGKENIRATRLAMACGLFSLRFWGNVVIVRSLAGRLEDLHVDSIFGACCISPDLRLESQIVLGKQGSGRPLDAPPNIPDWLADAARQNYHDRAVLERLALVMKEPRKDYDDSDDDSWGNDGDDKIKQSSSVDESIALPSEIIGDFLAKSSLCLHCRGPSNCLCKDCDGAYFCPEPRPCRSSGWSHSCQCLTWKLYVSHRNDLSTFPFLGDWCHELVGREFQCSELPYETYLRSLGIDRESSNSSWWRTEMDGWAGGKSKSALLVDATIRRSYVDGFAPLSVIPAERRVTINDFERVDLRVKENPVGLWVLESWRDYYLLRDLPKTSPVALLLTFPLTIYQSIVQYGDVPVTVARMLNRPLRIHVVGVEKELNFLDLFKEVGFLLPEDLLVSHKNFDE